MSLNYIPLYVAKVTSVEGRRIKAENGFMPAAVLIEPLLDGLIKLPAPKVGSFVLVFQVDSSNMHSWYLPIRTDFENISSDDSKTQIDSSGETVIDGSTIYLGDEATEKAVLGDALTSALDTWFALVSAHTHPETGGTTGPSASLASKPDLTSSLSSKVKLK